MKNLFKSLYPNSPEKSAELLKRSNLIDSIAKTTGKPIGLEFKEFIMFGSWDKIKAVGELLKK